MQSLTHLETGIKNGIAAAAGGDSGLLLEVFRIMLPDQEDTIKQWVTHIMAYVNLLNTKDVTTSSASVELTHNGRPIYILAVSLLNLGSSTDVRDLRVSIKPSQTV